MFTTTPCAELFTDRDKALENHNRMYQLYKHDHERFEQEKNSRISDFINSFEDETVRASLERLQERFDAMIVDFTIK